MSEVTQEKISKIIYSSEFERGIKKYKKDKRIFEQIENQIAKIMKAPNVGKPLRHSLKNFRRVHIGSFVLVYEIHNNELRFIDFDHHDKVYKKR